jgi:hypothetical protein
MRSRVRSFSVTDDAERVLPQQSGHFRISDRDLVAQALFRLNHAAGAPIPVMPARPLGDGWFVSPVRGDWVSVWSSRGGDVEWFADLCATLECPGVLFELVEDTYWTTRFFRDRRFLGAVSLPTGEFVIDELYNRAAESLEAEGVSDAAAEDEKLNERFSDLLASDRHAVREELLEERPDPQELELFLPPHARIDRAWDLLLEIDRAQDEDEEEDSDAFVEDYMERFAEYLGIRDASWSPALDAEDLLAGDYADLEGLPEAWEQFVLLPFPAFRIV